MDIVFDHNYSIVGDTRPVSLSFEDVIFVMEDVDAGSRIVRERDRSKRRGGTRATAEVRSLNFACTQWTQNLHKVLFRGIIDYIPCLGCLCNDHNTLVNVFTVINALSSSSTHPFVFTTTIKRRYMFPPVRINNQALQTCYDR